MQVGERKWGELAGWAGASPTAPSGQCGSAANGRRRGRSSSPAGRCADLDLTVGLGVTLGDKWEHAVGTRQGPVARSKRGGWASERSAVVGGFSPRAPLALNPAREESPRRLAGVGVPAAALQAASSRCQFSGREPRCHSPAQAARPAPHQALEKRSDLSMLGRWGAAGDQAAGGEGAGCVLTSRLAPVECRHAMAPAPSRKNPRSQGGSSSSTGLLVSTRMWFSSWGEFPSQCLCESPAPNRPKNKGAPPWLTDASAESLVTVPREGGSVLVQEKQLLLGCEQSSVADPRPPMLPAGLESTLIRFDPVSAELAP